MGVSMHRSSWGSCAVAVALLAIQVGVSALGVIDMCVDRPHTHGGIPAPDCLMHTSQPAGTAPEASNHGHHHHHDSSGPANTAQLACSCSSDPLTMLTTEIAVVPIEVSIERASIPIFRYEHAGLADITATIRRLGDAVGRTKNAEALASGIERDLDAIRARVKDLPKVSTLLVFGREPGSLRGIYASGGVGFLHDLLDVAGGTDAFGDVKKQSVVISSEQVLARAPAAIIELYDQNTSNEKLAAEQAVWKQLPSVPAVRNNQLHLLRGDFLTVPGPRIAQAARMMADALHPVK